MDIPANTTVKKSHLWWIFTAAALSFITTLFLPYVGEEGVYTTTSYEMWYHHHYLFPTLYGIDYGRPPFFNWLIIPLAQLLGWPQMLLASRLVTAAATLATAWMLIWFSDHLFKNRFLAVFSGVIFLTSDALIYHGWLAYSDPLFALLIFAAIACLWIGNLENRYGLIWLGAIAIALAFLTKALTAYAFYVVAFALLVWQHGRRCYLLRPHNLLPQILTCAFPLIWYALTQGANEHRMVFDLFNKLLAVNILEYIEQLIWLPIETILRFLPASLLVLYFLMRKRVRIAEDQSSTMIVLALLVLINFIPYWLTPKAAIRYVMPLYPFIALLIARLLWRMSGHEMRITVGWLIVLIMVKYIFALGFMPYYQRDFRGDYQIVAKQIIAMTKNFPLYTNDISATGETITPLIDLLIYPAPPIVYPSLAKEQDYFIINHTPDPMIGQVYAVFPLGKQSSKIYLLCKGKACG